MLCFSGDGNTVSGTVGFMEKYNAIPGDTGIKRLIGIRSPFRKHGVNFLRRIGFHTGFLTCTLPQDAGIQSVNNSGGDYLFGEPLVVAV